MKIAICQINPVVGDCKHNVDLMLAHCLEAKAKGADLAIFPELSICGYTPKDLLLRADFIASCQEHVASFAKKTSLPALVGAPTANGPFRPFNSAILCKDGTTQIIAHKRLLPNYNVFDEQRYFSAPSSQACDFFIFNEQKILLSICEDAWNCLAVEGQPKYSFDPIESGVRLHGAPDIIINMSASPFTMSKPHKRQAIFSHLAKTYKAPLLLCGQVGGNDQLLFDGHSMIIDKDGETCAMAKLCAPDIIYFDDKTQRANKFLAPKIDKWERLEAVLTMGIRDYVEKCRVPGLILGLSGGIDSALCLALACRAIGPDRICAVYLPSQYSSPQSGLDAKAQAEILGIKLNIINIEEGVNIFRSTLGPLVKGAAQKNLDLFDQNMQARTRCLMIMALANASGYIMLATSNKSELALGYTTIYGDMCGAFAPLGDVYKTWVYKLAKYLNLNKIEIPLSVINKEPSAELKHNQKDSDNMPQYSVLDEILQRFIDEEKSVSQIGHETGLDTLLIKKIVAMVNSNEFKRRQAPFSLMLTDKVFGDARRLPIAKNFSY